MTARPMADDARRAAEALRTSERANPVTIALADHLDAVAKYWRMWLPFEPSAQDRTALAVVRAVLAQKEPQ